MRQQAVRGKELQKVFWQSDYLIVSKKQGIACGEKGVAVTQIVLRRHLPYTKMGIKKILEAIYEQDFMEVSYGFRPNRSCHVMPLK